MRRVRPAGFTLLEVMVAAAVAAIIFAAIYSVFSKAIHLRDSAAGRARDLQLRSRAMNQLREDLRNGYVSNGLLALTLKGQASSTQSRYPGYLRFSTTTATMSASSSTLAGGLGGSFTLGRSNSDAASGDVQEVEYYVAEDRDSGGGAGALVRVVYQDLLNSVAQTGDPQTLLSGVSAMEVSFFDPDTQTWTDSWDETTSGTPGANDDDPVVFTPSAVRVRLRGAAEGRNQAPVICELLVPWLSEPWLPTPPAT